MSGTSRVRSICIGLVVLLGCGAGGAVLAASTPEDSFTASTTAAMARMDHDMMQPPSGDPDRDFAAMMIPHHQGAIDMALAELRFGHDPALRRLAQDVISAQKREIAVMQKAVAALRTPAPNAASRPMPMKMEH